MTLARALTRTAPPLLATAVVAAALGLGVPAAAVAAAPSSARADSAQQSAPALLRVGSRGLGVRQWQDLVNRALTGGTVDHPVLRVDGLYGPATAAATRAVQAAAGIAQDGIVGPVTRRALPALLPGAASSIPGPDTSQAPVPRSAPTGPAFRPPSSEPAGAVRVILRPDGLGFTDGGSSTAFVPFETDAATVRTAVDRALLPGGEMPTPDCGPGSSTVQHENLFLRLQDGEFVGWTTGTPGLTTGDGIGVGTTLAALRDALPGVRVTTATLGPEWSVDSGLAGFLNGTDHTSVVTSMGAGLRCLAR